MSRVTWQPTFNALTAAGVSGPVVFAHGEHEQKVELDLATALQQYGREYDLIYDSPTTDVAWWHGHRSPLASDEDRVDIEAQRSAAQSALFREYVDQPPDGVAQVRIATDYLFRGHVSGPSGDWTGAKHFAALEIALADWVAQGEALVP